MLGDRYPIVAELTRGHKTGPSRFPTPRGRPLEIARDDNALFLSGQSSCGVPIQQFTPTASRWLSNPPFRPFKVTRPEAA